MCTTTTTRNNLRRNICWLFNVDVFFPKITKVPSTFAYVLQGTQALWFLACPKKALENGKKLRVRERNGGRRKPCYNCTVHTYFVACKKNIWSTLLSANIWMWFHHQGLGWLLVSTYRVLHERLRHVDDVTRILCHSENVIIFLNIHDER